MILSLSQIFLMVIDEKTLEGRSFAASMRLFIFPESTRHVVVMTFIKEIHSTNQLIFLFYIAFWAFVLPAVLFSILACVFFVR